ncbi:hypothetical protein MNB_SV-6-1905 [hydrothermal vent metagenome]|uniref:Prepilin-type N-terminal cleavage/methylation domain-containing protein n=1 Tax=hydrothermal vent metagenome TaxID=652676 RepID=A0A1W1BNY2_9ZZZZ
MRHMRKRGAFTMLELVFVIVILGIVASIGSELIARVYQGYILQRAQHRSSLKTELAVLQIANRLSQAIPGTVVRRLTKDGATENIGDPMLLDTTGSGYTVLQWVGADMDSFDSNSTPGWSGFCDVDASSDTSISTPGSKLSIANTIEKNLGRSGKFAIFFPYDMTAYFGSGTSDTITLDNNVSKIYEHYKLAWTSYALVIENNDLYLYYNFPPTVGANIGGTKSLIMEDITTFKFRGTEGAVRFKICKEERISSDFNISSCKEKVVF